MAKLIFSGWERIERSGGGQGHPEQENGPARMGSKSRQQTSLTKRPVSVLSRDTLTTLMSSGHDVTVHWPRRGWTNTPTMGRGPIICFMSPRSDRLHRLGVSLRWRQIPSLSMCSGSANSIGLCGRGFGGWKGERLDGCAPARCFLLRTSGVIRPLRVYPST